MGFKALAIGINDELCQVLHVAHLGLCAQADFIERVPLNPALCGRWLEAQHAVARVLLPPSGRQRPKLALQVGDDGAFAPRKQRRDHQAHAFAASGRGVGKNVLRA